MWTVLKKQRKIQIVPKKQWKTTNYYSLGRKLMKLKNNCIEETMAELKNCSMKEEKNEVEKSRRKKINSDNICRT